MDLKKLYFKDTDNYSLISSLVFDVASFASMATSSLVTLTEESERENVEAEKRFPALADDFIRQILPSDYNVLPKHEIAEVPGAWFGSIIERSSRLWLISYVTGHNYHIFKRSVAETIMNFDHVWANSISRHVAQTIPLINNKAAGYKLDKLGWQIKAMNTASHTPAVLGAMLKN